MVTNIKKRYILFLFLQITPIWKNSRPTTCLKRRKIRSFEKFSNYDFKIDHYLETRNLTDELSLTFYKRRCWEWVYWAELQNIRQAKTLFMVEKWFFALCQLLISYIINNAWWRELLLGILFRNTKDLYSLYSSKIKSEDTLKSYQRLSLTKVTIRSSWYSYCSSFWVVIRRSNDLENTKRAGHL